MRRPFLHPGQPMRIKPQPADIVRFMAKVEVDATTKPVRGQHCWIWTAATDEKGYGQFKLGGRARWAHRVAYWLFRGRDVRHGQDVDHICFNRSCVNPAHLRAASRVVNSSRQPVREPAPF